MFAKLPTASLTVAELLFGKQRFAVPTYQRAYSWTTDEAGQLLSDLLAAAGIADPSAAEPDYFLGAVLLLDRDGGRKWLDQDEGGTAAPLDVVDGQQRLITLSILAAVLRDLDGPVGNGLWSRLDALLAVPGTGRGADGRRAFRMRLPDRDQSFLESHILMPGASVEMPPVDSVEDAAAAALLAAREEFMTVLRPIGAGERRALAEYLCDKTHVVAILTSDLDRAHRYFTVLNDRGRPLLKGDILKAEVLKALPAESAQPVLDAWDAASRSLGESFDRFFGHLKTIHGDPRPQVINAVRGMVAEVGGAEPFVLGTLSPLASIYRQILDAGSERDIGLPDVMVRRLVYLRRLNGEEWVPAAMLAIRRHLDGDPSAADLIAEIDRQAHLMRLLMLGGDKRARRFAAIVAELRSGRPLEFESTAFKWNRDDYKTMVFNLGAMWRRNPGFCKLLLLRLSDEIGGALTHVDPAALSIEHILPQRPAPGGEWRRHFPDAAVREKLTESLGNLVLLPQSLNESVRNFDFARKRALFAARDSGGPQLALINDVIASDRWTPAEIKARETRLLSIVAGLFGIEVKVSALMR